jgi:prepilin-type N-terminal cleavage/methylation domain-containing protein
MKLQTLKDRQKQKGFTLVELAVVMIIVGLLIGGILKGQELIANAQVSATISQIKAIEAAASTFRDSYRSFPGDMSNAVDRLPNCVGPCDDGDGDGRISNTPDEDAAAGDEGFLFFNHLLKADLIGGFEGTDIVEFGQGLPGANVGGGYYVGFHSSGALGENAGARGGHYLSLRGSPAAPDSAVGALSATQASRVDAKIDDGVPNTGTTFSDSADDCMDTDIYDTVNNPAGCNLYMRIQG